MLGCQYPQARQIIIKRLQEGPVTYDELEKCFESVCDERFLARYLDGFDTLRLSLLQLMDPSLVDYREEPTVIFDGKHLSLLEKE